MVASPRNQLISFYFNDLDLPIGSVGSKIGSGVGKVPDTSMMGISSSLITFGRGRPLPWLFGIQQCASARCTTRLRMRSAVTNIVIRRMIVQSRYVPRLPLSMVDQSQALAHCDRRRCVLRPHSGLRIMLAHSTRVAKELGIAATNACAAAKSVCGHDRVG